MPILATLTTRLPGVLAAGPISVVRAVQRSRVHGSHLVLALAAVTMADLGCMDFDLPPIQRDSGAYISAPPGGRAPEMGGSGGGGRTGIGPDGSGGVFRNDAPTSPEEMPGGGGGSTGPATGGSDVLVTVAGGSTGSTDVCVTGSGGAVAGTGGASVIAIVEDGAAGGAFGTADAGGATQPDAPADVVVVPTNGLIAYYRCDQLDGTTLRDRSGNSNNGKVLVGTGTGGAGGAGGTASPGYKVEPGKSGNGLRLIQAGNGYVSLPPGLFNRATDATITVWIKINTLTAWQRLFDVGVNAHVSASPTKGTSYLNLVLKDLNGKLGLNGTTNGYSGEQRITAEPLPLGTWKHVAAVLGSERSTLYVDGVAVGMSSALPTLRELGAIDYAYVGRSQFGGDPGLDAEIDELRVYNRALSASEVETVFSFAGL